MKKRGYQLEFISRIKPDGSGTEPVSDRFTVLLKDVIYNVRVLSLTSKTYIASSMSSFVVKLKSK